MTLFDSPVLMWVTDRLHSDASLPELARAAAGLGIDLIQIRERGLDRLPLELLIRAMLVVSDPATRIVVNSNIELARKTGVGVHLPESGPTIEEARQSLGDEAIIGRSVHSVESVRTSMGATYLIAGHVFETASKIDKAPLGLDRLQEIVSATPLPILAIGGITPKRVSEVLATGAAGVAVSSPLTKIETIRQQVLDYRNAMEQSVTTSTEPTISVSINGKTTELPAGTTIAVLLAGRELHERLVVVERNGLIVKRVSFPEVVIEEGDLLEIVHFVGGG